MSFTRNSSFLILPVLAATASVPAIADHNSRWGEGWANMPNDVHNTRIDTRGDNEAFRDFVRYGSGADSENRYATTDQRGRRVSEQGRWQRTVSPQRGGGGRR